MSATLEQQQPRLVAPIEQRVLAMKESFWIPYPQADKILQQLEALLQHPKTHRMPNLALIGYTNSGKSQLLEKFVNDHTPPVDPNEERTSLPVLMIQTRSPDEGVLYQSILEKLFMAGSMREHNFSKWNRVQSSLSQLGTRMLIFDEFSNASAGPALKQRRFLTALRYIGNELRIPIVVAGVPEALNALQSDPQLANRFRPVIFERWTDMQAYARLLVSYEPYLYLAKPCAFLNKKFVSEMMEQSEGILGETHDLLKLLAERSMKSGKEMIDLDDLEKKVLEEIEWSKPSQRERENSRRANAKWSRSH